MEDTALIDLYWQRDETAIEATAAKYGGLCGSIARNILKAPEDCEECLNDTYFAVWNAIPEQRPGRFSVFVSRITRNLALKKWEYLSAAKRNPAAVVSLEELGDCVSGTDGVEDEMENRRSASCCTADGMSAPISFCWNGERKMPRLRRRRCGNPSCKRGRSASGR